MRATNQKSCPHGFFILQYIMLLFSLYNLNTREHILTLSFYHKRYNDDKIKRS